jgi:hypothetical protein
VSAAYDRDERVGLDVDPYPEKPMLAKRLDEMARAAFSGGLGVTVLKNPGAGQQSPQGNQHRLELGVGDHRRGPSRL